MKYLKDIYYDDLVILDDWNVYKVLVSERDFNISGLKNKVILRNLTTSETVMLSSNEKCRPLKFKD